jgi:hypothetical protein
MATCLQALALCHSNNSDPISDWSAVTQDECDEFRMSQHCRCCCAQVESAVTPCIVTAGPSEAVVAKSGNIAAFHHAISNALDQTEDGPLRAAFTHASVDTVQDLLALDDQGVEGLTMEDGTPIPPWCALLIRLFQGLVQDREHLGDPIGHGWTSVTSDQFNIAAEPRGFSLTCDAKCHTMRGRTHSTKEAE